MQPEKTEVFVIVYKSVLAAFFVVLFSAPFLRAEPLGFEVASVKANKSTERGPIGMQVLPSGRLVISNLPLQIIVAMAYNLPFQSNRLSGGPDWIRSERFDIEATPAAGAIPAGVSSTVRQDMIRSMLQTLLAERFKMTVRRETKEQPVYAVVVGKNGPKLEKSKMEEKDCQASTAQWGNGATCHSVMGGQGRGLHGEALDIADFALYVSNWTDRPVVDKTGLRGLFNIQTDGWLPMRTGPAPAPDAKGEDGKLLVDQPTIFEIFERLGLKLEQQKAPVDMFVIEHAERLTEN
jgi:uncharacterized protein (TIGR03435 family)